MQKHKLKLVDMSKIHLEQVYTWRNELFIREVMYNSEPIKWESHLDWFSSLSTNDKQIVKILYYGDVPYGVANFTITNLSNNLGEWGFYIGEKNAPKGMGKALAYMFLNFLFEECKIRKICAEVLDYNKVSLKFHEKVGFEKEGILRKQIYKNNRFCDVHIYGIFKDEWEKARMVLEKELFD